MILLGFISPKPSSDYLGSLCFQFWLAADFQLQGLLRTCGSLTIQYVGHSMSISIDMYILYVSCIYTYIYIYLYTTKWINKTITKHIWKHAYACLWVHHKEINTLKTNVCMHRYIHTYICKLSLTPHLELDDIRLILLLSCGLFQ